MNKAKNLLSLIKLLIIALIFQFSNISSSYSQLYFNLPNQKGENIPVYDETRSEFLYPWAGGMNSCQFCDIDLNLDGIKDLIVFDRQGDRLMPFINFGSLGTIDYKPAPEYIYLFPELFDWVILVDYDMDGLKDIFTYSIGFPGVKVYKNISDTELKFELVVYPVLNSYQGGGYTNLYCTDVDYPAIADFDNDGDIDILTFSVLGAFVDYHQNQSMEKYGIPDSLDYVRVSSCWGHFAENEESNVVYLDTCIVKENNETYQGRKGYRHTGSTFLPIDLDGDDDKDILLGDVDYPNLVELTDGGDPGDAYITELDTLFPSYDNPINLFSMPVAAYIDVDNNGVSDLLVSAFDPGLFTSRNLRSSWLYFNNGQNDFPNFEYQKDDFLQGDMIEVGSGAYPVFADYDGDGLDDLFISNYGYYMYSYYSAGMFLHSVYWSAISLYKNTGTIAQPIFNRITHNFEGLQSLKYQGIFPTFGDIDGDGDKDMIIGNNSGTIEFLVNTAGAGSPMEFDDPIGNYQSIDVGAYSTPQLYDLNLDGLLDLAIGEEDGNLNYYENTGTTESPEFTFVTDSLGKVDVRAPEITYTYTGYSVPNFFRNTQDEIELLVGSEQGKTYYFKDIENNLMGAFTPSDSLYLLIDNEAFPLYKGIRSASAIADLNQDGFMDLLNGNFSGGLNYYSGSDAPPAIGYSENIANNSDLNIIISPNPAKDAIQIYIDQIEMPSQVRINIYNTMSKKVFSKIYSFEKTLELKLEGFPNGVYICQIVIGAENKFQAYEKFIISK